MLWPATYTDAQFAGDDLVQLSGLIESGELHSVRDLLIRQTEAQHRSGAVSSMGHSVTGTSLVLAEHLLSLHRDPVPEADGLYDTYLGELRAEGLLEDGP